LLTKRVFTPGPTQVPPEVLKAAISFETYHRSKDFRDFHLKLVEKLKKIFITNQNLNILTTSGTGAMEAAVVNFCNVGDKTLYINQGRFGQRWGSICNAYGIQSDPADTPYGTSIKVEQLKQVDFSGIDAVFFTHTETSTATVTDLKCAVEYVKNNSKAFIFADAITSVGAIEFKMDDWGIDVAVSASQKGLMTPPGLAVIAYSERAKEKMMSNPQSRFFFDLRKEIKSQADGLTTWTPAIGLFYGLDKASDIILNEGLESKWKRVAEIANYFRTQAQKMGFGLYSSSPSDSLTAVTFPDNIPTGKLISLLREKYKIQTANGQDELKDKIMRISHMGDFVKDDFVELCEIIKKEFAQLRD
jgi:aspartate aminotransferase-like enzyme